MSLTKAEWKEMWTETTIIKVYANKKRLPEKERREVINESIDRIRDKIQSVIGQME